MSKTRKGSRSPGAEYWSARPHNKNGAIPSKRHKKRTHKTERKAAKQDLSNGGG